MHASGKFCNGVTGHIGKREFHGVNDGCACECAAEALAEF
jgi:hypothetical protein